jgi:hypothetical protein
LRTVCDGPNDSFQDVCIDGTPRCIVVLPVPFIALPLPIVLIRYALRLLKVEQESIASHFPVSPTECRALAPAVH